MKILSQKFLSFSVFVCRNLKEKFQNRLIQNRDLKREIWILRQILKEMKQLEVFIELFNRCFPPCICAWKLICLSSIFLYFFSIRHGQDFPFLAVFTGYIAVVMTMIYGILYEKAFSIPEKMERLKSEFLSAVDKTTSKHSQCDLTPKLLENLRAEMEREIEAIRDVGIKVASFHTLERESTPLFVDFVVNQVVSLLVTFPK